MAGRTADARAQFEKARESKAAEDADAFTRVQRNISAPKLESLVR
jgi:hypothetical protein